MAGYPVPQPHPGSLADLGRALLRLLEVPDQALLGVGLGIEQPEAVHDYRSLGDQLAQQLPGTGSIFRFRSPFGGEWHDFEGSRVQVGWQRLPTKRGQGNYFRYLAHNGYQVEKPKPQLPGQPPIYRVRSPDGRTGVFLEDGRPAADAFGRSQFRDLLPDDYSRRPDFDLPAEVRRPRMVARVERHQQPRQLSPDQVDKLHTRLLRHDNPSLPLASGMIDSLDQSLMRARTKITRDILKQHEQAADPGRVFDDQWKIQFRRYGRRPPVADQRAGGDLRVVGKQVRQKQRQLADEYRRTMPPSLSAIAPPTQYDPRRRSGR